MAELQKKVKQVEKEEDYLYVRDWYLKNSPSESEGNERKDHVPFVLEQLSKSPGSLPTLEIEDIPFFDLIKKPARDVLKLVGGDKPLKWDSKAIMAA